MANVSGAIEGDTAQIDQLIDNGATVVQDRGRPRHPGGQRHRPASTRCSPRSPRAAATSAASSPTSRRLAQSLASHNDAARRRGRQPLAGRGRPGQPDRRQPVRPDQHDHDLDTVTADIVAHQQRPRHEPCRLSGWARPLRRDLVLGPVVPDPDRLHLPRQPDRVHLLRADQPRRLGLRRPAAARRRGDLAHRPRCRCPRPGTGGRVEHPRRSSASGRRGAASSSTPGTGSEGLHRAQPAKPIGLGRARSCVAHRRRGHLLQQEPLLARATPSRPGSPTRRASPRAPRCCSPASPSARSATSSSPATASSPP